MRFECDSCHAKYKIADQKVRGRVVRFPCRRCDHKILVDGRDGDPDVTVPAGSAYGFEEVRRSRPEPAAPFTHEAPTARARRPSSSGRRRSSSMPPRRPSAAARRVSSIPAAASSALVGQHPDLAPALPTAPAGPPITVSGEVPQWHVSINDVPVGPVRLEELGHKIDAGAVSEYSLVWREGLEEWRPLATVPELMALLHQRRHSGPPSRTSFSSMPPFVDSQTSITGSSERTVVSAPMAAFDAAGVPHDFVPLADSLAPDEDGAGRLGEMSQPPAPIGPPGIFESSARLGSFSGLPAAADEEVSVPSVPPAAAAASAEPRRGPSLGVLALIFAVIVLAGVSSFLAYERFGDSALTDWLGNRDSAPVDPGRRAEKSEARADRTVSDVVDKPEDQASAESGVGPDAEPVEAAEATTAVTEEPTEAAATEGTNVLVPAERANAPEPAKETSQSKLVFEPLNPANDGPTMAPAPKPKPKKRRRARAQPVEETSQEDSLSAAEQKILDDFGSGPDDAPAKIEVQESASSQSKKPPLDGDGVRATVTTNKPRLQRCYERAIRGQQSPESVRLDVSVTVAASGRVKDVSADGSGPGGLAECIEASVRRWRFPASSQGGPAKFPIVFSAN
ncbi:MAG: GYF domain-containing protein [Polyangiales bacterium]